MHLVGLIIRTVLVIGDAYGYCELTNLRIIKKKNPVPKTIHFDMF